MQRRAISPAITSLFLIGVAVTGGISAGAAMFKQNEIASKTTKIDVTRTNLTDMKVVNKTFFATNLKNTGTTTITSGSVGFYDDGGLFYSVSIPRLDPGQTFGANNVFDVSVSMNRKYLIRAQVLASDGSTYEWTDLQTASGG